VPIRAIKGKLIGKQRLDIFVAGEVVVEIKVVPQLTRLHKAQTISYLKTTGKQVGLLFNFGRPEPEFARLYYEHREAAAEPEAVERACAELPEGATAGPSLPIRTFHHSVLATGHRGQN